MRGRGLWRGIILLFLAGIFLAGCVASAADDWWELRRDYQEAEEDLTDLIVATAAGDADAVRQLLAVGHDPDGKSSFLKRTPLHIAAYNGDVEIAKLLIEAGAGLEHRDDYQNTPLSLAAKCWELPTITLLLDAGGNPNNTSNHVSPLARAWFRCRTYHRGSSIPAVALLLERGAAIGRHWTYPVYQDLPNARAVLKNQGWRPDDEELWYHSPEAIAIRIEFGGDLQKARRFFMRGDTFHPNDIGRVTDPLSSALLLRNGLANPTPLEEAAARNDVDGIRDRLDRGEDVNALGELKTGPIHFAALYGNEEALSLLIQSGAAIHQNDMFGFQALHYAAVMDHPRAVRLLLEHGAEVNRPCTNGGLIFTKIAGLGLLEMAQLILPRVENLDLVSTDRNGQAFFITPLMAAAKNGHMEMVELLLANGANPNVRPEDGPRPIFLAWANNRLEVAKLLLERGAELTGMNTHELGLVLGGMTLETVECYQDAGGKFETASDNPLTMAYSCSPAIFEYLLERGIGLDTKAPEQETLLHIIHAHGTTRYHRSAAEKLVARGADVNARDGRGRTPLFWAARANNTVGMEWLERNGADIRICDDNGLNALHMALRWGSERAAEWLRQRGLDDR